MNQVISVVLAVLLVMISIPSLVAQEAEGDKPSPKLVGNTIVGRVIKEEGEEKVIKDTSDIGPGSVLEYKMKYRNVGDAPAYNPALVNQIPKEAIYLKGSEQSETEFEIKFSADNGKTYSKKPMRKIKNKEGEIVTKKPIPPKEFTHIKWEINEKIEVGKGVSFKYRVRILKK